MKTLSGITCEFEVESYRFTECAVACTDPLKAGTCRSFDVERVVETRVFPPGSVVVPVAQPLAKLVI